MKPVIIVLAILCVVTAQSQTYDTRYQDRVGRYTTPYEPPPMPRHHTEYPPGYFTAPRYGVQIPEGPTTGYQGQRYWNPSTGVYEASPYMNNW